MYYVQHIQVVTTFALELGLGALLLEHGLSNHATLDLAGGSLGHDIREENLCIKSVRHAQLLIVETATYLLGQLELGDTLRHP